MPKIFCAVLVKYLIFIMEMTAENQKAVWRFTRDKIRVVILEKFIAGLTFYSKLTELADTPKCQNFSEIAGAYKKLECLMYSSDEDPFRTMNKIMEFLLTTNSRLLLQEDLLRLLHGTCNNWISRLFRCCTDAGSDKCTCFSGYLRMCMGTIRSYSYQQLCSELSPGDELFRRAFGPLIYRLTIIMEEAHLSTPDYTELYNKDAHALQALLVQEGIEFCITYHQSSGVHLNIDGNNKLRNLKSLNNEANNHSISYFIEHGI